MAIRRSRRFSILTAPLPVWFPTIEINTAVPALMEPGFNVCDFRYTNGQGVIVDPYIFDAEGQVRAYFDLSNTPGQAFPSSGWRTGNFIFGVGPSIYEIDIMARSRTSSPCRIRLPPRHPEMPDGSLIAAVNLYGTQIVNSTGVVNSIEDRMIQINRMTGAIMGQWDMRALLTVSRNEIISNTGDWST